VYLFRRCSKQIFKSLNCLCIVLKTVSYRMLFCYGVYLCRYINVGVYVCGYVSVFVYI
jgi:hypothetical protein